MNDSQRLLKTLNFEKIEGRGAVAETFFPWTLSAERWITEGLPSRFSPKQLYLEPRQRYERYFNDLMTQPVYDYEQYLGYDGVKRMSFRIPFKCYDVKIIENTEEYSLKQDEDGWIRKYYKNRALVQDIKPVVEDSETWEILKQKVLNEIEKYCTEENLHLVYEKYKDEHSQGKYSIRFRAAGFFWTPRELMGDEEELIAFYEQPELIHQMNTFILEQYKIFFDKIFDLIQPEVILFEEDLSGKNGPMISPQMFDEFVGAYYKELVPFLKNKGVKNIFVDTDGDFKKLIPNFIEAGVDGFLPMDVNAGMDIVEVRKLFPRLKFIGAFNKLEIDKGREAIDREFERLLPVIRQGGYLPGADHQVAPSASYQNYLYYIKRLKEVMKEAGSDLKID